MGFIMWFRGLRLEERKRRGTMEEEEEEEEEKRGRNVGYELKDMRRKK